MQQCKTHFVLVANVACSQIRENSEIHNFLVSEESLISFDGTLRTNLRHNCKNVFARAFGARPINEKISSQKIQKFWH